MHQGHADGSRSILLKPMLCIATTGFAVRHHTDIGTFCRDSAQVFDECGDDRPAETSALIRECDRDVDHLEEEAPSPMMRPIPTAPPWY